MKFLMMKPLRFLWRASRNAVCAVPGGAGLLFPASSLSARFGPGDAPYAWSVFSHHYLQLEEAGFKHARRMLEVGPGRNIGTALLWWAQLSPECPELEIICWDVFPNAEIDVEGYWSSLAGSLIEAAPASLASRGFGGILSVLGEVASGRLTPSITYRVEPIESLEAAYAQPKGCFDLIYSHAALEHVWLIDSCWHALARLSAPGGWHSHRIDMADHGKRHSNYIEFLEWSPTAYWLMLRFVPGATNRWRASHYLGKLDALGFSIMIQQRALEPCLPIPRERISPEFRSLADEDLRAVALDLVARVPS